MKNSLVKAAFAILITYFNIVPVYSQVFPASENNINLRWDKQRGVLSATAIDWPTDKPMVAIRSLSSVEKSRFRVSSIKLQGYKGELKWLHNKAGLKVTLPLKEIEDNTFVLDISIARIPNHLPLDYPNYQRSIDRGIEEAPVPEYEWASEEAYEAMNDTESVFIGGFTQYGNRKLPGSY